MAATGDRYGQPFCNKSNTEILITPALALQEYRNEATASQNPEQTIAQDDASFCEKFFCHDVVHDVDKNGKKVLIGLLDSNPMQQGSGNTATAHYNSLHAAGSPDPHNRIAIPRMVKEKVAGNNNFRDYIVLNDGGLNTKAYIGLVSVSLCCQDLLIFTVTYRNAWYANTSNVQAIIRLYHNGSLSYTLTRALADMPMVAKSKSSAWTYITQDVKLVMNAAISDTITIQLQTTNEEGVYTTGESSPVTVTAERVKIIDIYKVTSVNSDPVADGLHYYALLYKSWYTANLSQGDDGYPNLYNLFQRAAGVSVDTTVRLIGQRASAITADILTSYLPDGLYYGIPDRWEDPEETDPQAQPKTVSTRSSAIGQGQAYQWANQVIPQPVVTPEIQSFTAEIGTSGQYTSYADDNNGVLTIRIYPHITARGKGMASFSARVSLIDHNNNDEVLESKSFAGGISFGSSMTTKELPCIDPEDEQMEGTVPYVAFTHATSASEVLRVELEVTDVNPTPASSSLTDTVDVDTLLPNN